LPARGFRSILQVPEGVAGEIDRPQRMESSFPLTEPTAPAQPTGWRRSPPTVMVPIRQDIRAHTGHSTQAEYIARP